MWLRLLLEIPVCIILTSDSDQFWVLISIWFDCIIIEHIFCHNIGNGLQFLLLRKNSTNNRPITKKPKIPIIVNKTNHTSIRQQVPFFLFLILMLTYINTIKMYSWRIVKQIFIRTKWLPIFFLFLIWFYLSLPYILTYLYAILRWVFGPN